MIYNGRQITGVVLTDKKVFISQVEYTDNAPKIKKIAEADLEQGLVEGGIVVKVKETAHFIKKIFSENDIRGKEVSAAVISSNIVARAVKMSRIDEKDKENFLKKEADKYMMFGEESVADGFRISKDEVFMIGVRKKEVNTLLSVFDKAGLVLTNIDLPFLANLRAMDKELGGNIELDSKQCVMAIVCNEENSDIFIIKEGIPVYSRRLTAPDISELYKEVMITSTYWEEQFPGINIAKTIVLGDVPRAKELEQMIIDRVSSAGVAKSFGPETAKFSYAKNAALGLAIPAGKREKFKFNINLLSPERFQRMRLEKAFLKFFIFTASVLVMYFFISIFMTLMVSSYKMRMKNTEERLAKEINVLSEVEQLNKKRIDAIDRFNAKKDFINSLKRRNWPKILEEVRRFIPKDVWLTELSVEEGKLLLLKGKAYDQDEILRYIDLLGLCEEFDTPELSFIEESDGLSEFNISCFLGTE